MYIPAHFKVNNTVDIRNIVQAPPFGMLLTMAQKFLKKLTYQCGFRLMMREIPLSTFIIQK